VTIGQLQEAIGTPPPSSATSNTQATSQEAISAPPPIPGVAVATATATDDSVPDVPIDPVPVPVPVPASVNCVGSWGDWSACSAACGGGKKSRTYAVTIPASGNGNACIKQNGEIDEVNCNSDPCPIDCVGEWGSWGDCSLPCGGGVKTRTYTHTRAAAHGGTACDVAHQSQETQACNTQACPVIPVACVGAWGEWGACSQSCGGGMKSRTYAVTTPASGGGQACPANNGQIEETACNTQACPVACVGAWGEWGACSQSCGGGTKTRTYTVATPASGGGQACPVTDGQNEQAVCNTQPCPVNCQGGWGEWSACSRNEQGYRTQTYTVTRPAANGGAACPIGNGVVQGEYCGLDREVWTGSAEPTTSLSSISGVLVPGPSSIYGELEFRLKYKHYPGTAVWSKKNSGLNLYVNGTERAYLSVYRNTQANIASPWTRIRGVKGGDYIQVRDRFGYTVDGAVGWKFHPNDNNPANPDSGSLQTGWEYF